MTKVILITGGSRGIGATVARLAGQQGYSVCVNYRQDREAAESVVESIEDGGARAIAVLADVSVESPSLSDHGERFHGVDVAQRSKLSHRRLAT